MPSATSVTTRDDRSRVRCTGQRSAIRTRPARCSSVRSPVRCNTRVHSSILGVDPDAAVSQSSQWVVAWRTSTSARSSGIFLCSAYMRMVIDVHPPSAAASSSYGLGPAS